MQKQDYRRREAFVTHHAGTIMLLACLLCSFSLLYSPSAHAQNGFSLLSSPSAQAQTRLYVSNTLENTVSVVDTNTNTTVATIPAENPYGIVTDSQNNRVYVANTNSSNIEVIDAQTNTIVTTIPVVSKPLRLAISHDGTRLYAGDQDYNGIVTVIDTGTNTVLRTISGFDVPQNLVLSLDDSRLYVQNIAPDIYGAGSVSVVDTSSFTIIQTIPVGDQPSDLAMSPDGTTLYVPYQTSAGGFLAVIDTASNMIVDRIFLASDLSGAHRVIFNTTGTRVYAMDNRWGSGGENGSADGTVYVIDTATNTVIHAIPVGLVPNALAISPDNSTLYVSESGLPSSPNNAVSIIDTQTDTITGTITVGHFPTEMALGVFTNAPVQTTKLYVSNINDNSVSVIDPITGNTVATIPVGNHPATVVSNGTYVYVANYYGNGSGGSISVINPVSNTVVTTISLGSAGIERVALSPV